MSHSMRDAGFVMIDALMATALIALAGTTVVFIANGLSTEKERVLDRSVALVMSQSIMKQYLMLGPAAVDQLQHEDELFTYEVSEGEPSPALGATRPIAVVAEPKIGAGRSVQLDFLAPADWFAQ
jgi:hypothetical protein